MPVIRKFTAHSKASRGRARALRAFHARRAVLRNLAVASSETDVDVPVAEPQIVIDGVAVRAAYRYASEERHPPMVGLPPWEEEEEEEEQDSDVCTDDYLAGFHSRSNCALSTISESSESEEETVMAGLFDSVETADSLEAKIHAAKLTPSDEKFVRRMFEQQSLNHAIATAGVSPSDEKFILTLFDSEVRVVAVPSEDVVSFPSALFEQAEVAYEDEEVPMYVYYGPERQPSADAVSFPTAAFSESAVCSEELDCEMPSYIYYGPSPAPSEDAVSFPLAAFEEEVFYGPENKPSDYDLAAELVFYDPESKASDDVISFPATLFASEELVFYGPENAPYDDFVNFPVDMFAEAKPVSSDTIFFAMEMFEEAAKAPSADVITFPLEMFTSLAVARSDDVISFPSRVFQELAESPSDTVTFPVDLFKSLSDCTSADTISFPSALFRSVAENASADTVSIPADFFAQHKTSECDVITFPSHFFRTVSRCRSHRTVEIPRGFFDATPSSSTVTLPVSWLERAVEGSSSEDCALRGLFDSVLSTSSAVDVNTSDMAIAGLFDSLESCLRDDFTPVPMDIDEESTGTQLREVIDKLARLLLCSSSERAATAPERSCSRVSLIRNAFSSTAVLARDSMEIISVPRIKTSVENCGAGRLNLCGGSGSPRPGCVRRLATRFDSELFLNPGSMSSTEVVARGSDSGVDNCGRGRIRLCGPGGPALLKKSDSDIFVNPGTMESDEEVVVAHQSHSGVDNCGRGRIRLCNENDVNARYPLCCESEEEVVAVVPNGRDISETVISPSAFQPRTNVNQAARLLLSGTQWMGHPKQTQTPSLTSVDEWATSAACSSPSLSSLSPSDSSCSLVSLVSACSDDYLTPPLDILPNPRFAQPPRVKKLHKRAKKASLYAARRAVSSSSDSEEEPMRGCGFSVWDQLF